MAKRFKATLRVPSEVPHSSEDWPVGGLHATRERALKAGVDEALKQGLIVVNEVEVEQKVTRQWVEKTK